MRSPNIAQWKNSPRWRSENRLLLEERSKLIDVVSLSEGQSTLDVQGLSESLLPVSLVLPIKMKLSSRMIDFRLASKGPYHYFPPTTAFLPIIRRRDRTRTSRVIAAVEDIKGERFLTLSILSGVGLLHICASLWRGCRSYSRFFRSQFERQHWLQLIYTIRSSSHRVFY